MPPVILEWATLLAQWVPNFEREYHGQTTIHPLGLALLVVLGGAMLVVPRSRAFLPVLCIAAFIAPGQRIVVASLDFDMLRIMVLFGWARLILRSELRPIRLHGLDYAILVWQTLRVVAYVIERYEVGGYLLVFGKAFDAIGMYFLFRFLIRDFQDIQQYIRDSVPIAVFVLGAFTLEQITLKNVFSAFGGVAFESHIREGRLRAQGAFVHPILAGCFWASLIPLYYGMWKSRVSSHLMVIGAAASVGIVICCASSTPVVAVMLTALGIALYPIRQVTGALRLASVAALLGLHFTMEKPVWHLLSRIDIAGGSTGWHRYNLINKFIENFDDWWLSGAITTAPWGVYDLTNHYVVQGVQGGLAGLAGFVVVLVLVFRGVSRIMRAQQGRPESLFAWCIGVTFFVHSMNFLAISYFGQITVLWYMHLAVVGSLVQAPTPMPDKVAAIQPALPKPLNSSRGLPEVFA